jgi:hypothetical protein
MSEFFCLLNPLKLSPDHFPVRLLWLGVIYMDLTVWLEGARPPLKYAFKNNMSLMNSKIQPARTP